MPSLRLYAYSVAVKTFKNEGGFILLRSTLFFSLIKFFALHNMS